MRTHSPNDERDQQGITGKKRLGRQGARGAREVLCSRQDPGIAGMQPGVTEICLASFMRLSEPTPNQYIQTEMQQYIAEKLSEGKSLLPIFSFLSDPYNPMR